MWEYMNNYSLPQIIVGDFNDIPAGEVVQFLTGNKKLDGKSGNFKDAWKQLHGEDIHKGWTYTTLQEEPKKRIDFVLYRGDDLILRDIQIIQNVELNTQPSDHRGLYADLTRINKQ